MNREEQIAEIAKIICGRVKDDICIIDRTSCDSCCNWARQAEKIYNAGYRKINDLKAENKQLKTECALLDDELRIARQDTINVLNKLKEKIQNAIDTYYNSQGGGYYLAEDVINDIDELLKEYE